MFVALNGRRVGIVCAACLYKESVDRERDEIRFSIDKENSVCIVCIDLGLLMALGPDARCRFIQS